MSLRILHVFDHSLPLHSGYTFRSRAILDEQHRLGWQTAHLTSAKHAAGESLEESIDGLTFHRTRPGALRSIPVARQWDVVRTLVPRIVELASRHHSNLIHAHSPCLNGLAALRAANELGLPVVYEVRAFWEDAAVDLGTSSVRGLRYHLSRLLETSVLRRAAQVTCICEGLRADIVGRGVNPGKVTVIPNAVDVDRFPLLAGRDEALARRLGVVGDAVVGFIGSFYAYEGLDLLLEAFPNVLARRPRTRLLLVGGGPQQNALVEQASRLGIAGRVTFTGRVPHELVPAYSSLIDAFVFPRKSMRLTELVTPLKPLEAMAQGRLVLASDVGGHRELIEHGTTGLLFRHGDTAHIADTILEALDDLAACRPIIEAGRAHVARERTWRSSVQRYLRVYEAALAARGRSIRPD